MTREILRRGFSLVELLVVASIIALLAAVLGIAIGPRLRAKTEMARTKTNLRQLAMAINLYMADNNDDPPPSLRVISAPGLVTTDPRNGGSLIYTLGRVEFSRKGIGGFEDYGFNPASNSVIKCPGVNDWHGETTTMMVPNGKGGVKPFEVPSLDVKERLHLLGVRLDGTTGWFDPQEQWEKSLPQPQPIKGVPAENKHPSE